MKKLIIATLSGFLFLKAGACDVCGGGVNNLNPYLFPHLSKSYIGLSYLHNHYRLTEDGSVRNQYNNAIVFTGQHTIKNRLQLLAFLPVHFNTISSATNTITTQGLGDVTILANYHALQKKAGKTNHVISAGGGIKLATGEYNAAKSEELNDQNFQLGSGSTDYIGNLNYRFATGKFSMNALSAYKYTAPNKNGYRYGDMLTVAVTAAYVITEENFSLAPYVQLINETYYRDADNHVLQNHSGGDVLYSGFGIDVSAQKMTLGINYQAAASQNLIQGQLQARPRFSARLSFSL